MADQMHSSASRDDVYDPPVESILCERCSILRIDDRAEGFEIREGRLQYTKDPAFEGAYNYQTLDYSFSDQLPHLDGLRIFAEAGCAFCGALRDAVLTTCLNTTGKVTFGLTYSWWREGLSSLGLTSTLKVEGRSHRRNLIL